MHWLLYYVVFWFLPWQAGGYQMSETQHAAHSALEAVHPIAPPQAVVTAMLQKAWRKLAELLHLWCQASSFPGVTEVFYADRQTGAGRTCGRLAHCQAC